MDLMGDIFNLTLPNQKSYDNNTMDLSLNLDDLKLFESLDLDGGGAATNRDAADGTNGGSSGGGANCAGLPLSAGANGNCGSGDGGAGIGSAVLVATVGTKSPMNGGAEGDADNDDNRCSSRSSSLGLNAVGGGGASNDHDLMDGALEDDGQSLCDDSEQECKICK